MAGSGGESVPVEQHAYEVSIGRHTFDPAETRPLRTRRIEARSDE